MATRRRANLGTYDARYYEARWLAGWLAGTAARRGVAGYVAGFPVPEVVQGINAFTLGMRAVNPKAEVRVVWLNTWFDPAREREAALALINQGADVLTNHSGSPAVPQAAEEKGVKLLAYQSDMARSRPHAQLAAVTHHWGGFYTQETPTVMAGQLDSPAVWGGMKDGMVRLSARRRRRAWVQGRSGQRRGDRGGPLGAVQRPAGGQPGPRAAAQRRAGRRRHRADGLVCAGRIGYAAQALCVVRRAGRHGTLRIASALRPADDGPARAGAAVPDAGLDAGLRLAGRPRRAVPPRAVAGAVVAGVEPDHLALQAAPRRDRSTTARRSPPTTRCSRSSARWRRRRSARSS